MFLKIMKNSKSAKIKTKYKNKIKSKLKFKKFKILIYGNF